MGEQEEECTARRRSAAGRRPGKQVETNGAGEEAVEKAPKEGVRGALLVICQAPWHRRLIEGPPRLQRREHVVLQFSRVQITPTGQKKTTQ